MTWWTDENNFRCLPSTDHAWGFSYQYTILLTSVNSIWLLVTAALWLLTGRNVVRWNLACGTRFGIGFAR
ncbi:hypothetical protein KCU64_g21595, partial [Aureobasidium melanogenum]